jgi:hypothetical protein
MLAGAFWFQSLLALADFGRCILVLEPFGSGKCWLVHSGFGAFWLWQMMADAF